MQQRLFRFRVNDRFDQGRRFIAYQLFSHQSFRRNGEELQRGRLAGEAVDGAAEQDGMLLRMGDERLEIAGAEEHQTELRATAKLVFGLDAADRFPNTSEHGPSAFMGDADSFR